MRPAISIDVLGQSGSDAAEAEDNNSSTGSGALWIVALVLGLGLLAGMLLCFVARRRNDHSAHKDHVALQNPVY